MNLNLKLLPELLLNREHLCVKFNDQKITENLTIFYQAGKNPAGISVPNNIYKHTPSNSFVQSERQSEKEIREFHQISFKVFQSYTFKYVLELSIPKYIDRSSHQRCFIKQGGHKNFTKFTVKFMKFSRAPFYRTPLAIVSLLIS